MLITQEQQIVLRSAYGDQLMQWLPGDIQSLQWGRELRQVSKCDIQMNSILTPQGNVPPIAPFLHWIDVYSTDDVPELYWSGPLLNLQVDRFSTSITAVDVSAYLARTRVPITKSWDATDPSVPALALWEAMLDLKGINHIRPIQRVDPYGDRFNSVFTADSETLDKTMQSLEQMGFRWTVVAGVPILGPMPYQPIAALGEDDFIGRGIALTRDGSKTYNDILLRGADNIARGRVDLHGLSLQTIVSLNDMFGLTNVNNAVQAYARNVATFRNSITVPAGSILHPDVDLIANQLIPSARFTVSAYGERLRLELDSVQVSTQSGRSQVAVTLTEVPDWTEIGAMLAVGGQSSFQSGTRNTLGQGGAGGTGA